MKNMIIASTSTTHGSTYLVYLIEELKLLFNGVDEILFIPYARPSGLTHQQYTAYPKKALAQINISVRGIHEFDDPAKAIQEAKGIFVGGGNTFMLTHQLYKNNVMTLLKEAVLNGTPYLGSSAGSNICGLTMQTTNDMPVVYPPSFKTMGLVPFNINPHYLDSDPDNKHMGETRETRIKEFLKFNTQPVVGLREGSWLRVQNSEIKLCGIHSARTFEYNKTPYEIPTNSLINIF